MTYNFIPRGTQCFSKRQIFLIYKSSTFYCTSLSERILGRSSVAKPWRIKGFSLLMVNVGSSWVQGDMVCAACSHAVVVMHFVATFNASQVWSACLAGGGFLLGLDGGVDFWELEFWAFEAVGITMRIQPKKKGQITYIRLLMNSITLKLSWKKSDTFEGHKTRGATWPLDPTRRSWRLKPLILWYLYLQSAVGNSRRSWGIVKRFVYLQLSTTGL